MQSPRFSLTTKKKKKKSPKQNKDEVRLLSAHLMYDGMKMQVVNKNPAPA